MPIIDHVLRAERFMDRFAARLKKKSLYVYFDNMIVVSKIKLKNLQTQLKDFEEAFKRHLSIQTRNILPKR